jgi:hypothetical protein
MEFLDKSITVDCGLHTAYAIWDGSNQPETGEFHHNGKLNCFGRSRLCICFGQLLNTFYQDIDIVYLEGTQKYYNLISQTAIAKGTLFELSYLVGRYEQLVIDVDLECKIINAPEWKGQMTKDITEAKIRMLNDRIYSSEHIMDAVGMGFGIVDAFNWEIRK